MRIEALSTALTYFDMDNVFQIVPAATVELLIGKLEELFLCQAELGKTTELLAEDPANTTLLASREAASLAHAFHLLRS